MNNPLELRYEPTAFRVGLYALCLALAAAAGIAAAAIGGRSQTGAAGDAASEGADLAAAMASSSVPYTPKIVFKRVIWSIR